MLEPFIDKNNNDVYVEFNDRYRQINRDLSLLASYPFSRASRIELSGGYEQISFSHKLETAVYDAYNGSLISDKNERIAGV